MGKYAVRVYLIFGDNIYPN